MNLHLAITLTIAGAAIVLLLTERLRADLVALLVVVALGTSGVLTSEETFSGFSRSAVITLLAIFILAAGLERTGITRRVGALLVRVAGRSEQRLVVTVMLAAAFLSLFMNNIAAAAVLLPAVSGAAQRSGVNPSRLLMPLAFGTILGGMATLLTTTNIVVSSLLRDRGLAGFRLLDFAPLGLPIVAAGIAYMALWGRRLLPARSPAEMMEDIQRQEASLAEVYHLGETLARAGVPEGSGLAGLTLAASRLREAHGASCGPRPPKSGSRPRTSSCSRASSTRRGSTGISIRCPRAIGASAISNPARWCSWKPCSPPAPTSSAAPSARPASASATA
jgi:di/tricarboxylate transporter